MLKRVGYIFIMLLLLFCTTGVTITRHYCGNHLVQTSIYSTPHISCNANCPRCHNERIEIRISDKFQSSQFHTDFTAQFKTLLKNHVLPTILALSSTPSVTLLNYFRGDHPLKPSPVKHFTAGHSTAFLQVFLV
jgi:hypothetical protein